MKVFNTVYYSFSPQVAEYEREQPWLQATVKVALYPLFGILMAAERLHSRRRRGWCNFGRSNIKRAYRRCLSWTHRICCKQKSRKVDSKLLATIFGSAMAVLAITLVALNEMLPLGTVSFVIASWSIVDSSGKSNQICGAWSVKNFWRTAFNISFLYIFWDDILCIKLRLLQLFPLIS